MYVTATANRRRGLQQLQVRVLQPAEHHRAHKFRITYRTALLLGAPYENFIMFTCIYY